MMKNKNVILITIDALRADHLGFMGYHRNTSPNIDRLAKEGILFTQAISNAPYTTASITTLLTSTYPLMHEYYILLGQDRLCISEILSKQGYSTCGIHSNPWFSKYNYKKGFKYFKDPFTWHKSIKTISNIIKGKILVPYARADELNREAIYWLQNNSPHNFFLWLHYMDVHEPYIPLQEFYSKKFSNEEIQEIMKKRVRDPNSLQSEEKRLIVDLYDGEIKYVDDKIAELVRKLYELCDLENTIIVITADHGEELGDHGHYGHGGNGRPVKLYDELLHVPLIILGDSLPNKGKNISNQIGLIDLSPTILDLMGIKKPDMFMGKSVLSSDNWDDEKNVVISQGIQCKDPNQIKFLKSGSKIFSCRTSRYKLIYKQNENQKELYNLKNDPKESKNIIHENPKIVDELKDKLFTTLTQGKM